MFDISWLVSLLLQVLPMVAPPSAVHPHHPFALTARGAGGELTVTYMTVDFNPDRLEGLADGFEWHLAFAALDTPFPLRAGAVEIPAGKYKLDVVLGAERPGEWSALLTPYELWRARNMAKRARDDAQREQWTARVATLEAECAARGAATRLVPPTVGRDAAHAEHLSIELLLRGYPTRENGSTEATGGLRAALWIDMGDEHRVVDLVEVVPAKDD